MYSFAYCKIPTDNTDKSINLSKLIKENEKIYDSSVLKEYPWNFFGRREQDILNRFQKYGCAIQDKFSIVQGFRTGDNKAFIVDTKGKFIRPYVDGKYIGRGVIKKRKILYGLMFVEKIDIVWLRQMNYAERIRRHMNIYQV